ncbi:MAG: hypothetical protein LBB38_00005, partial [Puniceicoccales bacterium]|nr:hypothetical protein [Puniceicoccales bacterium]
MANLENIRRRLTNALRHLGVAAFLLASGSAYGDLPELQGDVNITRENVDGSPPSFPDGVTATGRAYITEAGDATLNLTKQPIYVSVYTNADHALYGVAVLKGTVYEGLTPGSTLEIGNDHRHPFLPPFGFWDIYVENTNGSNADARAAAIDLKNLSGNNDEPDGENAVGPMSLKFIGTAPTYISVSAYYGGAAAIGSARATNGLDAQLNFWNLGHPKSGFISVRSGSSAVGYGLAWSKDAVISSVNNWTIGVDDATSCDISVVAQGGAAAYGIGFAGNGGATTEASFNNWMIGDSDTRSVSTVSRSQAVAYGLASATGTVGGSFNNLKTGNFYSSLVGAYGGLYGLGGAAAFGYGENTVSSLVSNSFNGFSVGAFDFSKVRAVAFNGSAVGFGYGGNLLGIGLSSEITTVEDSFNNATFGYIDSADIKAQALYGYASVFGAASVFGVKDSFNNYTFGVIRDSAISAISWSYGAAAATAFGGAYVTAPAGVAHGYGPGYVSNDTDSFKNWSIEFNGSNAVASFAFSTVGPHFASATAVGGWTNKDMRVYFSGDGLDELPLVTVAGVKGAFVPGYADGRFFVTAQLGVIQGNGDDNNGWGKGVVEKEESFGWARAFSMGDGFQINVGRTRGMIADWQENAAAGHESIATDEYGNVLRSGGWEAELSAENGGYASGRPGTLNIIGSIARSPQLALKDVKREPDDTIMRIDSGWTVNCFGPVKDLRAIDLISGRLVILGKNNDLMSLSDPKTQIANQYCINELANSARQLSTKLSCTVPGVSAPTDEYIGDRYDAATYQGRIGFVDVNYEQYPIAGSLRVYAGDTLRFHASTERLN